MIVYLVATLLSCLLAWQAERMTTGKWAWRLASALPLTLVAALRWDVGTDVYHTYVPAYHAMKCLEAGADANALETWMAPLFNRLHGGLVNTVPRLYENYLQVFYNQEWGFRQIMRFMSWAGWGYRGLQILTASLIGGCVFTAIYRQSRLPILSIYLYVATSSYFLGLNIVRQYVAIGFMLVAIEFVVRRKFLPFLACVLAGMVFHTTVVVLLPFYFLLHRPIRPVWAFALVGAAFAFSSVADPVVPWILPKIGLGHYCRYFSPRWRAHGFEFIFFAINMCYMVLGAWYWKKARKVCPFVTVWYNMTVLGTMLLALSGVIPLIKRINHYLAAPQFLLLPALVVAEERPRIRRILLVLVVLVYAVETFYAVYRCNKNEPLPYRVFPAEGHADERRSGFERFWWTPGT